MTGYTFIYNGRKYWVPQGVPMEKAINYINSEKIGIGGVAGLVAKTKSSSLEVSGTNAIFFTSITRNIQGGTKIGITTGKTSTSNWGFFGLISYPITEITLSITLSDTYTAGTKVWVWDSEVNFVAGAEAEGAGFPIKQGVTSPGVEDLQKYMKRCGATLGTNYGWWGPVTQEWVQKLGLPSVINSQSELNAILSKPCTNVSTNTNAGGTTQGSGTNTNAGGTTQGSGTGSNTNAGGNNAGGTIIKEEPITTTPPKDNTLLWVASAFLAKKIFFGKKGKKK